MTLSRSPMGTPSRTHPTSWAPASRWIAQPGTARSRRAPALMPTPAASNAVPLTPAEPDWGRIPAPGNGDTSARKRGSRNSSQPAPPISGRRLIDRELPDSSAEERDLWHETMKDVPLNDLRELLRLRTQLGRLSPSFVPSPNATIARPASPTVPEPVDAPSRALPPSAVTPPYLPAGPSSPVTGRPEGERIVSETLAAIDRARQAILNNIANAATNGYKRHLVAFETAATPPPLAPLAEGLLQIPLGSPLECGSRMTLTLDPTAGKIAPTGRNLDLAVDGEGFFHVAEPRTNREAYTRRGRFTVEANGQLTLEAAGDKWALRPPIAVPAGTTRVDVAGDGQVRGWDAASNAYRVLGSIQTATFVWPASLVPRDGTLFVVPAGMAADLKRPARTATGSCGKAASRISNVDLKQEVDALARLAEQAQMLEQAGHLMHPGHMPMESAADSRNR